MNYLFFKIAIISYIKYNLERNLCLTVKEIFTLEDYNEFNSVKNGLGNKINKAISINKTNQYGLSDKLNKFMNIHEKYKLLYNQIDHGTMQLIAPYLSASIKDIKSFYEEMKITNV